MEDIKAVSKVVVVRGKRILFLKRAGNGGSENDDEWELPGGHLNVGERFRGGAKREVREETGIIISKLKVILKEKDFVLFLAKPRTVKVKLSNEHKDYKWVNMRSILKLNLSKPTQKNLKHILKCL
jgi:8-oxo-dGTP diphosphatase